MRTDTIAAISTAIGTGGISIVRISGEEAFSIINQIFDTKLGTVDFYEKPSHRIYYGCIKEKEQIIDEVMVMCMKEPHTYTKEDTIEINCHGGILVTKRILEVVLKHGARLAEAGEFTKRAFLNGRIDLSQAESVMDLISAKNDLALKSSLHQLQGSLGKSIQAIRKKLIYEIAFIESALDDPEHISLEGYADRLLFVLEGLKKEIEDTLAHSENGELLKEGIKTVIVGKPNVGKSSLMNLLVGEDRAIVTEVPGTTRDVLKEQISLNGIPLQIIDTAGIRSTTDQIEKIGVEKAQEYLQNADLVLYLIDLSKALDENDEKIKEILLRSAFEQKVIILLNKSDLPAMIEIEELKKQMTYPVILFSVKQEKGMDLLAQTIQDLFFQGELSQKDEDMITNVRHKSALLEAKESLQQVIKSIHSGMPEDFYSIDLTDAYEALGRITGESMGEDLVNEIFSKFCMGK